MCILTCNNPNVVMFFNAPLLSQYENSLRHGCQLLAPNYAPVMVVGLSRASFRGQQLCVDFDYACRHLYGTQIILSIYKNPKTILHGNSCGLRYFFHDLVHVLHAQSDRLPALNMNVSPLLVSLEMWWFIILGLVQ